MGEELILAFAKVPVFTSEDGQERIWTQEEWDAFIDAFTDAQLHDTFVFAMGASPEEVYGFGGLLPPDELREHLKTMLKEAFADVNGYCRDILEFTDSAGVSWFVGGGTTWGDTPAGYDTVVLIEGAQSYGPPYGKGSKND